MTVVVGFVGPHGAVMVADGEATEPDSHSSHQVHDKIWTSGGLLFGYTGNSAVRDPLKGSINQGLAGFDTAQGRCEVGAALCGWVKRVLDPLYANFVPTTASLEVKLQQLGGTLLVIGRDCNGHWLLDINHHNTMTPHWERGFHTVGSGSHAAEVVKALLDNLDLQNVDCWKLKLVAYRAVATCIKVAGPLGVGGSVHLWSAEADAEFEEALGPELDGLGRNVQEWEQSESELFSSLSQEEPDPLPEEAPATEPSEPVPPSAQSRTARKA